ncbi:MAG: hypothetical protein H7A45_13950 [Verrucomicrobiales bacterium]|nr:hypothetical protein [Verrucomicrobiales bacterium]
MARRLRQWRERQRPPGPLPQRVWAGAAQAACEHGVSQVAQVLGFDYHKLKRRPSGLAGATEANGTPPGFVELNLAALPSVQGEWTLELADPADRKPVLRGPSEPACWLDVARAIWAQEA